MIHGILFALSSLCPPFSYLWNLDTSFMLLTSKRIFISRLYLPQIEIPAVDTTYWCQGFLLPDEIRQQTRYITRVWSKILSICHLQVIMSSPLLLLPPFLPSSLSLSYTRLAYHCHHQVIHGMYTIS